MTSFQNHENRNNFRGKVIRNVITGGLFALANLKSSPQPNVHLDRQRDSIEKSEHNQAKTRIKRVHGGAKIQTQVSVKHTRDNKFYSRPQDRTFVSDKKPQAGGDGNRPPRIGEQNSNATIALNSPHISSRANGVNDSSNTPFYHRTRETREKTELAEVLPVINLVKDLGLDSEAQTLSEMLKYTKASTSSILEYASSIISSNSAQKKVMDHIVNSGKDTLNSAPSVSFQDIPVISTLIETAKLDQNNISAIQLLADQVTESLKSNNLKVDSKLFENLAVDLANVFEFVKDALPFAVATASLPAILTELKTRLPQIQRRLADVKIGKLDKATLLRLTNVLIGSSLVLAACGAGAVTPPNTDSGPTIETPTPRPGGIYDADERNILNTSDPSHPIVSSYITSFSSNDFIVRNGYVHDQTGVAIVNGTNGEGDFGQVEMATTIALSQDYNPPQRVSFIQFRNDDQPLEPGTIDQSARLFFFTPSDPSSIKIEEAGDKIIVHLYATEVLPQAEQQGQPINLINYQTLEFSKDSPHATIQELLAKGKLLKTIIFNPITLEQVDIEEASPVPVPESVGGVNVNFVFTSLNEPVNTPTPNPTNTPNNPTPTEVLATPTPSLTPLESFESKVPQLVTPGQADFIRNPGYVQNLYEGIPPGTKLADFVFTATGESRININNQELGPIAEIRLVYRASDGTLHDLWMQFAGYNFGVNPEYQDGYNAVQAQSGDIFGPVFGSPKELLRLVKPGGKILVVVPIEKGSEDEMQLITNENWGGTRNELAKESYRLIEQNKEEIQTLLTGQPLDSEFTITPFSFTLLQ